MGLEELPAIFTEFRKAVEKQATVRPLVASPIQLPKPPVPAGNLPSLEELGYTLPKIDPRQAMAFKGGERAGLARVQQYYWEEDRLRTYKDTRNGLLGQGYSSKFSPWLALGCLSPRYLVQQVVRYEEERVQNQSTYWMLFELLWRDYFRWVTRKFGAALFFPRGIKDQPLKIGTKPDMERFEQWRTGQTGVPFVDANMRELLHTGFMSNRGRQNVASFLVKDLGIDWRWGAQWFEAQLIDYDVASNWANWNYVAGVGNDPREHRYFHVIKQAQRYDPEGAYVRHWLPELAGLSAADIHTPYACNQEILTAAGVALGKHYPFPVVTPPAGGT